MAQDLEEPPRMYTVRDNSGWIWLHLGSGWIRHTTRERLCWAELNAQHGPLQVRGHLFGGRSVT